MFESSKINHPLLINKRLEFKFTEHGHCNRISIKPESNSQMQLTHAYAGLFRVIKRSLFRV